MIKRLQFGIFRNVFTRPIHLARTMVVICSALLPGLVPAGDRPVRSSARDTMSLEAIAELRPCAAIALYYIDKMFPTVDRGAFYLESVPTFALVAALVKRGDRRAEEVLAPMQPNLYSDTTYAFVAIRWSVHHVNKSLRVVSTEAQIVDMFGLSLTPARIIEPLTSVSIAGKEFHFVGRSSALCDAC